MSSSKSKNSSEFKTPPQFKYQEGEKVLCFHGPLIYEAKCLQAKYDEKDKAQYHVHYSGWNKSWDEWVPECRVLKYNEVNLAKQKELYKAQKAEPKGKKTSAKKRSSSGKDVESVKEKEVESRSSTPVSERGLRYTTGSQSSSQESGSDVPNKRRRLKQDTTIESEEQFLSKVEVKIKIPDELKPWLVDDHNAICIQKKMVVLPARVTVDQILEEYKKTKTILKNSQCKEKAKAEIAAGIQDYFNAMCGSQLLYRYEKKQYQDIMKSKPNSTPSQIYGTIHLIRLFVRLGAALTYTDLDEKQIQFIHSYLQDFLKFVYKNAANFYNPKTDYGPPTVPFTTPRQS